MADDYIHLEDFEEFVRNRFKDIINGEGLTISRITVKAAINDIFSEDAILITDATDSEDLATRIHEQVHNGASISDIVQTLTRRR